MVLKVELIHEASKRGVCEQLTGQWLLDGRVVNVNLQQVHAPPGMIGVGGEGAVL